MTMRSRGQITREIALRRRISDLSRANHDSEEGWGTYASASNRQALARAESELSDIGELDWSFDGDGVHGHAIETRRLAELADGIHQTLHWTARDLIFLDGGRNPTNADLHTLAEPLVTGTFRSSFGLRMKGPAIGWEQLSFEGSLFDRTMEKLFSVFEAAQENDQEAILEHVAGLRSRSVDGWKKLAKLLADADAPTTVRFHGTPLTLHPSGAAILWATIQYVDPVETSKTVFGRLQGVDLDTGMFHLIETTSAGAVHYSGRAEPAVIDRLLGISIGVTPVRATVAVITTTSPVIDKPKLKYVLTGLEAVTPPVLDD